MWIKTSALKQVSETSFMLMEVWAALGLDLQFLVCGHFSWTLRNELRWNYFQGEGGLGSLNPFLMFLCWEGVQTWWSGYQQSGHTAVHFSAFLWHTEAETTGSYTVILGEGRLLTLLCNFSGETCTTEVHAFPWAWLTCRQNRIIKVGNDLQDRCSVSLLPLGLTLNNPVTSWFSAYIYA